MSEIEELMADILWQGLDDWVPIGTPREYARVLGAPNEDTQLRWALLAAERLQAEGLVRYGRLSEKGWCYSLGPPQQAVQEVLEVEARKGRAYADFALWLENTDAGNALAHSRLESEFQE